MGRGGRPDVTAQPVRVPAVAGPEGAPGTAAPTVPRRAVAVHLASLVVAAAYLVWSARGSQFYADEWGFLARLEGPGPTVSWLLEPHNEHWTLVAKATYAGIAAVGGTGSVWPYLGLALVLHLTLVHLLWRLALQGGADATLTTIACAGLAVYAAGVENILWAFQTTLLSTMVLGTLAFLEMTRSRPRGWRVAALCALAVMTSGLSVVFVGLVVLAALARRRIDLAWTAVPAAVLELLWYLVQSPSVATPPGGGSLALLPVYWALGLGNVVAGIVPFRTPEQAVFPSSAASTVPVVLLGAVVLLAALVAAWRRPRLRPDVMVAVFLLGAPTFVLLTSLSRLSAGIGSAMLSRYAYVGTAFLVPWALVLLTRIVRDHPSARRPVLAGAALLLAANAVSWWAVSGEWTSWTRTNARIITAGQELVRSGAPVYADSVLTPEFAFLSPRQVSLLEVRRPAGPPGTQDRLSAALAAQTRLVPVANPPGPCGPVASEVTLRLDADPVPVVVTAESTPVEVELVDPTGARSHVRGATLGAGAHRLESLLPAGSVVVRVVGGEGVLSACPA